MARGKKKRLVHAEAVGHADVRVQIAAILPNAYEVGGGIRDELAGKGEQAKDVDIAVEGLTYDELAAVLEPHGFVDPNIVGGGKLGLRLFRHGGPAEGELVKPERKESYRVFYERLSALGRVEPEVYDGEGRLVGCRLRAPWTPDDGVEISLARTERSTGVGRANFAVDVDPNFTILDDLSRRDFTVNAIARNLVTGELIDPFNGASDIANKVLRVVGTESFREDPSRIIRGLVRVAKDDLDPDAFTLDQMREHAPLLASEPVEQIWRDLEKLLAGRQAAKALRLARDVGALDHPNVLPELAPIIGFDQQSKFHSLTADEHTFHVLDHACAHDAPLHVRLAAVLHDAGKGVTAWMPVSEQDLPLLEGGRVTSEYAETHNLHFYEAKRSREDIHVACQRCRGVVRIASDGARTFLAGESCEHCGNRWFGTGHEIAGETIARECLDRMKQPGAHLPKQVALLVREHMFTDDVKPTELGARRFIQRVGRDNVEDLLLLRRCDRSSKDENGLRPEVDAQLTAWEQVVRSQMQQPLTPKELDVRGDDPARFGFKHQEVGEALRMVLEQVTVNPELNERSRGLRWLAKKAVRDGLLGEPAAEALVEQILLESEQAA
jgi:tRNA nucleotidyltransferase/poly(A) polymerase